VDYETDNEYDSCTAVFVSARESRNVQFLRFIAQPWLHSEQRALQPGSNSRLPTYIWGEHGLLLATVYTQDNERLNNDALHLLEGKLSTPEQ
jgi:hypothetical protein